MADAPKPWRRRQASTTFLRVPRDDWPGVRHGHKTEFRMRPGQRGWNVKLDPPTPVVCYAILPRPLGHVGQLMVLEETFIEPLGAISEESLGREGFPSLAHFRRYWMERNHRAFPPLLDVQAFRVRPIQTWDHEIMGRRLMERLYGEWM